MPVDTQYIGHRFEPFTAEVEPGRLRFFAKAMGPDYKAIPSSFEIEGDFVVDCIGDRGDGAMFLSGCSRFLLALAEQSQKCH